MDASEQTLSAKRFRERLKQFREQRFGWTQSELADHAKVSVVTISKLEQGKNLPTFDVLIALCTAMTVSPDELTGWAAGTVTASPNELFVDRLTKALHRMPAAQAHAIVELAEKLARG